MSTVLRHEPRSTEADSELLARVLRCYKPHCRYLTSAVVSDVSGIVTTQGRFTIGKSCYIDDTGHLNAVEVNICYNQLLYYTLAAAVRDSMIEVLADWHIEDFWARQLPDVLISRFTSSFRRPIDRSDFTGTFELRGARRRQIVRDSPLVALDTAFRFTDASGGSATGEAVIAIVTGTNR